MPPNFTTIRVKLLSGDGNFHTRAPPPSPPLFLCHEVPVPNSVDPAAAHVRRTSISCLRFPRPPPSVLPPYPLVGCPIKQDHKRLMLVSGGEDTTVRLWSLSQQSCIAVLKAHLSYVTSLAFLPGGTGLISGGRDRVLNVWGLDRCAAGLCSRFVFHVFFFCYGYMMWCQQFALSLRFTDYSLTLFYFFC